MGDAVFRVTPKNLTTESGNCVTFNCDVQGTKPIGKFLKILKDFIWGFYRSTVAQMAERAPLDRKVPSLIPALDFMRCVYKNAPY